MKKFILSASLLIGLAVVFTACTGNFMQDMFNLVSGHASSTVRGSETEEYDSSIAMNLTEIDHPCTIGLCTSMDIDALQNIHNEEDLEFPFMSYRFVGSKLTSGSNLTVNNDLTNVDIENFDYRSLLDGSFAENNVVAVAVSATKFYVMSTGNIHLKKVNHNKVVGDFSGSAYVIDIEAEPKLSEEQVSFSGDFKSRVIPVMDWLVRLQDSIQ